MSKALAEKLFPNVTQTPAQLIADARKWGKSPCVTRIAPSPTGDLHIGTLGMTICDFMLARANNGIVYLRIEDTDQKREVKNATQKLIGEFKKCGIVFDEGFDGEKSFGGFGPYVQSQRTNVYHTFAKALVEHGRAYPEYNDDGSWCLRLKMDWNGSVSNSRINWNDAVRGEMSLPARIEDPVIIKSNGIPPYNFAHIIDDTLMGTTHVLRGEEWLPSTAEHIQIWRALFDVFAVKNFTPLMPPWAYAHMPVICVEEDGSKRKLSKRKDKEALVENFLADGWPVDALIEYLLTLYNTDYELWRLANPGKHWLDFNFRIEKVGCNSFLFDWAKLTDISKDVIVKMPRQRLALELEKFFAGTEYGANVPQMVEILCIDKNTERPRKDIAKWSEIPSVFEYLFKEPAVTLTPEQINILHAYKKVYSESDDKDTWLARIKALAAEMGVKTKDAAQAIRIAITGREHTTDLYYIMKILGADKVSKRLSF